MTLGLSVLNRLANPTWRKNSTGVTNSYAAAVPDLAELVHVARSDIHIGCEAGTYDQGELFNKALGWGGKKVWCDENGMNDRPELGDSFVLHGGTVTQDVGVNPRKTTILECGQYTTVGDRNKWVTWALTRTAEVLLFEAGVHLEFEPRGVNKKGHWGNQRREDQLDSAMKQAKALAKGFARECRLKSIPIVVAGDMNGDADDPHDGPGEAAARHGFLDSDKSAQKRTNGTKTTHARKDWNKGGRIDRIFHTPDIEVVSQTTLNAWPDADHALVGVQLIVTNVPL